MLCQTNCPFELTARKLSDKCTAGLTFCESRGDCMFQLLFAYTWFSSPFFSCCVLFVSLSLRCLKFFCNKLRINKSLFWKHGLSVGGVWTILLDMYGQETSSKELKSPLWEPISTPTERQGLLSIYYCPGRWAKEESKASCSIRIWAPVQSFDEKPANR